jgi:hypothetical protein
MRSLVHAAQSMILPSRSSGSRRPARAASVGQQSEGFYRERSLLLARRATLIDLRQERDAWRVQSQRLAEKGANGPRVVGGCWADPPRRTHEPRQQVDQLLVRLVSLDRCLHCFAARPHITTTPRGYLGQDGWGNEGGERARCSAGGTYEPCLPLQADWIGSRAAVAMAVEVLAEAGIWVDGTQFQWTRATAAAIAPCTFRSGTTARRATGPLGPAGPAGPGGPAEPGSPLAPTAPGGPGLPWGPGEPSLQPEANIATAAIAASRLTRMGRLLCGRSRERVPPQLAVFSFKVIARPACAHLANSKSPRGAS